MRSIIDVVQTFLLESAIPSSEAGWLYHGTGKDKLPAIAKNGLVPQKPSDNWPEFDDWQGNDWEYQDYDEEVELPSEAFEARTFFTLNANMAQNANMAHDYSENHGAGVVLRVPETCTSFEEGETDFPYFYTTKNIPPTFIQVWSGTNWVPIQVFAPQKNLK